MLAAVCTVAFLIGSYYLTKTLFLVFYMSISMLVVNISMTTQVTVLFTTVFASVVIQIYGFMIFTKDIDFLRSAKKSRHLFAFMLVILVSSNIYPLYEIAKFILMLHEN